MKFKKIFTGLISLAATLIAVCAISICAGAETSGDYEYSVLSDGTVEITGYTGSATDLTIPSTLGGKKVTTIGVYSFSSCSSLTSVTIPNTVTSIYDCAFFDCSSLTSINIPDSVTSIAGAAFSSTPFLNNQTTTVKYAGKWAVACDRNATIVSIKSGTVGIADYTFYLNSNLTSVDIPKGVKYIGHCAFFGCNISSVKIPDGVTSIGICAFSYCSKLSSVTLPDSITKIGEDAFIYTPLLDNQTSAVKYVGKWAVYCEGKKERQQGKSLGIYSAATYIDNDHLNVTIKDGTVGISDNAFYHCENVLSMLLPAGIRYIGNAAFSCCTSLTSITIPDSVTSIGSQAFRDCSSLKDVYYIGSKSQWDKISIGTYNESLLGANIHYLNLGISGLNLKGRSGDALRISWTKNAGADGYIIERKDGSQWVRVAKITKNSTTEYRIDKLKAGTAYNFRVKAYKMDGKTALYSGYTTISARTNPSTVSGLKLKGRAADALRLAWTKNTSADGYIIERKDGSQWVRVAKITKNSTTEYRIDKLKAGTAYNFRIRAYKMSGKTALYSAYKTISATTNPSVVSGLKLKAANSNAVRLAWEEDISADGYIIEQKVDGEWTRVGKITKNSTVEFRKSGLNSKTSYLFRVKAYKTVGKTALYSATKTITVKTK